jgi:hypothetical protein
LAPGLTAIVFSPPSATVIRASPLGTSGMRRSHVVETPASVRAPVIVPASSSSPTQPTKPTSLPSRAAATAWLAPLPPGERR